MHQIYTHCFLLLLPIIKQEIFEKVIYLHLWCTIPVNKKSCLNRRDPLFSKRNTLKLADLIESTDKNRAGKEQNLIKESRMPEAVRWFELSNTGLHKRAHKRGTREGAATLISQKTDSTATPCPQPFKPKQKRRLNAPRIQASVREIEKSLHFATVVTNALNLAFRGQ